MLKYSYPLVFGRLLLFDLFSAPSAWLVVFLRTVCNLEGRDALFAVLMEALIPRRSSSLSSSAAIFLRFSRRDSPENLSRLG
jgi:hypothetical protein